MLVIDAIYLSQTTPCTTWSVIPSGAAGGGCGEGMLEHRLTTTLRDAGTWTDASLEADCQPMSSKFGSVQSPRRCATFRANDLKQTRGADLWTLTAKAPRSCSSSATQPTYQVNSRSRTDRSNR